MEKWCTLFLTLLFCAQAYAAASIEVLPLYVRPDNVWSAKGALEDGKGKLSSLCQQVGGRLDEKSLVLTATKALAIADVFVIGDCHLGNDQKAE